MIQSNESFRLKIKDNEPFGGLSFYILKDNRNGNSSVATSFVFEESPQGGFIDPILKIDNGMAQSLFNDLWFAGYRPKDGTGNSGHIQAMAYHLEDMRKLVFKDKK